MAPQPLPHESALPGAPHLTVVDDTTEFPPAEPTIEQDRTPSAAQKATSWVRDLVTPPDIVHKPRPSLEDLATYGRENAQVPDQGALRAISRAWSYLALVQATRGYVRAWLWERATRALIVVTLLIVFFLTPPGRVVLAGLTWIPYELHLAVH